MRYTVIEAPSILGLHSSGVDLLPSALLQTGLLERLQARHAGRVAPTVAREAERDPETLTFNAPGIAVYSLALADALGRVLDRGEFPVVLGGDCSILLGDLLALRRRGRYGLLFVDGHTDFYNPEANPNGEVASMDLAFATGRGPEPLTNLEGRGALVRDQDIAILGYRDEEESAGYGSQPLAPEITAFDLAEIRRRGVEGPARDAVAHLTRPGGPDAGFWIHVDADVLDDAIMPAVDYRLPGGLTWEELTTVIRVAMASRRAVGLEVTIYNPTLDSSGDAARGLARVIGDALA